MNNFASLEKTMPPATFEVPYGFSVHKLNEDLYIVSREDEVAAGLESIQQEPTDAELETLADRAAKHQLEIEESLNPTVAMFWTEFEQKKENDELWIKLKKT